MFGAAVLATGWGTTCLGHSPLLLGPPGWENDFARASFFNGHPPPCPGSGGGGSSWLPPTGLMSALGAAATSATPSAVPSSTSLTASSTAAATASFATILAEAATAACGHLFKVFHTLSPLVLCL